MALLKSFRISSFLPPGIVITGGQTYVCPGWHKVPINTTLKEVQERWTQELPKGENKPKYKIEEEVISSKGDKTYSVTFDGSNWSCTCVGFGFYRNCKHLKEVKIKHNT